MYFNEQVMEINRNNYETFFLLYLDRELNPAEKQEVENFLAENADLQKEFKQLQQTVLAPAEIVFEPKELLFRKEEKRRVIPFYRMQDGCCRRRTDPGQLVYYISNCQKSNQICQVNSCNVQKKSERCRPMLCRTG